MCGFLNLYQHIPGRIDPVAFSFGGFSADWYSLMYLLGFGVVYFLLQYRLRRGEYGEVQSAKCKVQSCSLKLKAEKIRDTKYKIQDTRYRILDTDMLLDLLIFIFVGLLVGARLGYVLFYDLPYYIQNPIAIVSPFDPVTHQFIGIYGMSYHGGLVGVIIAAWIFVKRYKLDFWRLADFVAPAVPAGYFFGRIGNFLNGELYGRITDKSWGMYFPQSAVEAQNLAPLTLRHPSQLYEAILEGIILFLILWPIRNRFKRKGQMLGLYLVGYSLARIFCEFFRQPDVQVGFLWKYFTIGQFLSLLVLFCGIFMLAVPGRRLEDLKKVV